MDRAHVNPEALWRQYQAGRDQGVREQLILHYVPLVKRAASRIGIVESGTLDYGDLLAHGMAGLIEAVDRFDPERGVPFEGFAGQRIRGSILDALRALDFVSRNVRRRATEIQNAINELRGRLGVLPSDEEIACYLHWDLVTYRDALTQSNIVLLSLDNPFDDLNPESESVPLQEALEDHTMQDLVAEFEERDLKHELALAIHELPEREQLCLSLYYYDELTVREVAEVMQLSPSRISQLLARAIMTLRAKLVYNAEPGTIKPRGRAGRCMSMYGQSVPA